MMCRVESAWVGLGLWDDGSGVCICSVSVQWELLDVQAESKKGRETRDQIANTHWIIERAREFQKNIYFCFIDFTKAFDCVDHNELCKILKEMGIPDQLTCLLRNLYVGQKQQLEQIEATVRTLYGTNGWLKIAKVLWQFFFVTLFI